MTSKVVEIGREEPRLGVHLTNKTNEHQDWEYTSISKMWHQWPG